MRAVLIAVVASCAMIFTSCEVDDEFDLDSTSAWQPESSIVNGEKTGFTEWTGVVAIRAGGIWGGLCTGTLIHPRVVLSAGHCVKNQESNTDFTKNPGRVSIVKGPNAMAGVVIARAEKIVTHPTWTGDLYSGTGDLSMLYLDKEITDLPIYPIRDFPLPKQNDKGIIVGYGASATGGIGAGIHRKGDTSLLDIQLTNIETGSPSNTCQGDSGGPLFTEQGGEWTLTGVTSFGQTQNCSATSGAYSVNLLAFCDWLNDAFEKFTGQSLGLEKCGRCDAVTVEEWGQPCGTGYSCCPEGTKCRFIDGFSDGEHGICAPSCCAVTQDDPEFCSSPPGIPEGKGKCDGLDDVNGGSFCTLRCLKDADCPEGTVCSSGDVSGRYVCTAKKDGPGEVCEEEPEDDVDTGGEGEGEGDDGQGEGEGEGEGEGGVNAEPTASSDGCGCRTSGAARPGGILSFLRLFL